MTTSHERQIPALIDSLRKAHAVPFQPREFIDDAYALLRVASIERSDVADHLRQSWDPGSCLPHPVDTDDAPFLIDLDMCSDWCLRATVWPVQASTEWRDRPHSHFGHIATTAITPFAYRVRIYDSFPTDNGETLFREIPLQQGAVHLIHPETIHEIVLPESGVGISLSVRTRSVVSESREYDPVDRIVRTRTKTATDRKEQVLSYLLDA